VRVLFGEMLGVSNEVLLAQLTATVAVGLTAWICARPFLLLSFSPEQAQVAGFPAQRFHMVMLALIALMVIVSFQTVGTLLVFGMLIAPSGAAALIARRISRMMLLAAVFGSLSVYVGLLASYHLNIAAGASIVLVTTIWFFVVFTVQNIRWQRQPRGELHSS